MPIGAFKDLCIDVADAALQNRFWTAALGLSADGDPARITGPTPQHTIWVNEVPEPKVVKHRLHLDLHTGSVDELVALGARVLDDTLPWTLMADPEGGEFCAFVRDEPPPLRLYELVLDAHDPRALTTWWAELIGGDLVEGTATWGLGDVPGAPFEWFCFNPTTDPKVGKNRVHIDVVAPLDAVLTAGATLLRARGGDISWDVLADPEGNEFCVFAPPDGAAPNG